MPPKTKEQKEEIKITRLTKLYQSVDNPDSEIVPRTMKSSKTIAKDVKKTVVKKAVVKRVVVKKAVVKKAPVKKSNLYWQSLKKMIKSFI